MVRSAKSLIPVELLRRSARGKRKELQLDCVKVKEEKPTQSDELKLATPFVLSEAEDAIDSVKKVKLEVTDIKQSAISSQQLTGRTKVFTSDQDGYLLVDDDELDLERTLLGGQSFRWIKQDCGSNDKQKTLFTGTIGNNVFQLWRCDSKRIAYKRLNIEAPGIDTATLLKDYFQLKYKLTDLYEHWSRRDENFKRCSEHYKGFRILRQDPVENVFSFICATNNNIKRISLMICSLCRRFGLELFPKEPKTITPAIKDRFFTFPTVERLAQEDVFNVLRYELGFGYRAKFICETAKRLMSISSDPRDYLMNLRRMPYKETCKKLQEFPGIGRKVADCISLMSMDHLGSVPIDCHIYEIVCRNYMKTLRLERKTLTEKVHDMIGDYFVDLHGPLAGWATSVLFVAELKHLKRDSNGDSYKANKRTVES
jgi:N-glycosylase/DNA lyase